MWGTQTRPSPRLAPSPAEPAFRPEPVGHTYSSGPLIGPPGGSVLPPGRDDGFVRYRLPPSDPERCPGRWNSRGASDSGPLSVATSEPTSPKPMSPVPSRASARAAEGAFPGIDVV